MKVSAGSLSMARNQVYCFTRRQASCGIVLRPRRQLSSFLGRRRFSRRGRMARPHRAGHTVFSHRRRRPHGAPNNARFERKNSHERAGCLAKPRPFNGGRTVHRFAPTRLSRRKEIFYVSRRLFCLFCFGNSRVHNIRRNGNSCVLGRAGVPIPDIQYRGTTS